MMISTNRFLTQRILPLAFLLLSAALSLHGCGKDEPTSGASSDYETALGPAEKHLDPGYLCPMHPQVVSSEPGECPICGMDLVAKEAEASEADSHGMSGVEETPAVRVSDAVVNQLGVRTAEVRRGTLSREVEGFGVFTRSTAVSSLLVVAQVFEREALLVRQGQSARVRFPGLGAREWTGKVTSLEPQVSPTTHTLQVRVSVDSGGASVPGGMTAIVGVTVDPVPDVLLVPREAVIVTGKGARVVVAQGGGRFQPRQVEAEDLGEDEIVIRKGLSEGERVVVSAQFLLDSEANLHAGLKRLSGGQTGAQPAPEGTIHEGDLHVGHMHEAATPEGAPAGEAMQEHMPEPIRELAPEGAAQEGNIHPSAMDDGPNAGGAAQ